MRLKYPNFTFEQLKQYAINRYLIRIKDYQKLKIQSKCTFRDDIAIETLISEIQQPFADEVCLQEENIFNTKEEREQLKN